VLYTLKEGSLLPLSNQNTFSRLTQNFRNHEPHRFTPVDIAGTRRRRACNSVVTKTNFKSSLPPLCNNRERNNGNRVSPAQHGIRPMMQSSAPRTDPCFHISISASPWGPQIRATRGDNCVLSIESYLSFPTEYFSSAAE
jgi:hypothetical protein